MNRRIKINTETPVWIALFLLYAIPVYGSNIFVKLTRIHIGSASLSMFHLFALLSFCIAFTKARLWNINRNNLYDILFVFLFLIRFVYIIVGVGNGYHAFSDFTIEIMGPAFYIIIKTSYRLLEAGIADFCIKISRLFSINLIINLVMLLTENTGIWGVTRYLGNKWGGYYFDGLLIFVPISMYLLISNKYIVHKSSWIFYLALGLLFLVLNDSRALFLIVIMGAVVSSFIALKSDRAGRISKRALQRLFPFVMLGLIFLCMFLSSNASLLERLLSINWASESDSLGTRFMTYDYNISFIKNNIFGEGLGFCVPTINRYGRIEIMENKFYVDNYLITFCRRLGVIPFIMQCFFYLLPIVYLYQIYKQKREKDYIVVILIYLLLLFQGTVFSSQLYHCNFIYVPVWAIAAFANEERKIIFRNRVPRHYNAFCREKLFEC